MKIYFSVDFESVGEESLEDSKKIMDFLQEQGHVIYRASYVFSENPTLFLQKELKLDRNPTHTEQREIHMKWIDWADLLLANISAPSEGRSMIIQRAIDKSKMGLPFTPIILIKRKETERRFGKVVRGLIESGKVVYYEYENTDEVIKNWSNLLQKANSLRSD